MKALVDTASPPEQISATFDRKYGVLVVHATREEALREQARDPAWIDLHTYARTTPGQ